jgi:ribosomal protein S18 acetylase RimI-like enzyme
MTYCTLLPTLKIMKLVPMSESEYAFWAPRSRQAYAEDKMKANSLTKSEADKIADAAFEGLLPDGLNSKDNFLFSVKDEELKTVGYIWFCIRGESNNRRAFICDIIIEEPHRGKGFGKKTMLLIEQEIKKQGLNRVGLHVFGFNTTAINLYQSLGYLTTDLVMEKVLDN